MAAVVGVHLDRTARRVRLARTSRVALMVGVHLGRRRMEGAGPQKRCGDCRGSTCSDNGTTATSHQPSNLLPCWLSEQPPTCRAVTVTARDAPTEPRPLALTAPHEPKTGTR